MIKKYFRIAFGVIVLCYVASASAALNIVLTQGVDRPVPLSIVNFSGPTNVTNPLMATLRSDLGNSGQFDLLDTSQASQSPHSISEVNYSYWRKQDSDYLVIGKVTKQTFGGYNVRFSLLDVLGNTHVLIDQGFSSISDAKIRGLAHHIGDMIYQKITGKGGYFSTKIAYILTQYPNPARPQDARYSIEMADYDGNNPRILMTSRQPIMSLAWAPDGKELVYVSFENGRSQIYSQDLVNGSRKLIASYPGINSAPAFSPDGRSLAVVLSKDGSANLYKLDLATNKLTRLTNDWAIDTEPSWTPDGQGIIFTSDRGGRPQVYELTLASGKVKRLTFDGDFNARPVISPNGKEIAMVHRDNGYNIAVQNLATGQMQVLTTSGQEGSPSFSPNGTMLIYASEYGEQGVLGMASVDGRVKLRLPALKGSVKGPAWSPKIG